MQSRRDFLKAGGALVVSFALNAQGPFDTHPSHVDPKKLDSWLAVAADGTITAHTGKCDFGQGMFTAQTQLVAEELCVPIARVKLIQCDTDVTPDQGTTSGSQSTPTNFNEQNLGLAAATAREALLTMAAKRLGEPREGLKAADGAITAAGGKRVTYAELVGGKVFNLTLDAQAKRIPPDQWKVLGKPVASLDRPELMTGRFEYVYSMRVPGMLHGRVVRPPEMGATLAGVDEASIQHIIGAKVVTQKNFVGVVAETQHDAIRAARELKVRWNPGPDLPAQTDFYDYMQKQPSRDDFSVDSGDAPKSLAAATKILSAKYRYPYQMHGSVGTSCAVADVKSDHATVWSSTQSVYPTRSIVAKMLNLPLDNVRVIFKRGSGCYGLNGADAVSFDAAVLSHAVQRPVRLQYSREDEMKWENYGAACVIEHKAALGTDGKIAAWDRVNWVAALGNRPGYDAPGNVISGLLAGFEPDTPKPAPARPPQGRLRNQSNTVPAYFAGCVGGSCEGGGTIRSERVLTHTVKSLFFTGPLRSPLRIQNTFANECFMDELCVEANADPVLFRLQHLSDQRLIGVLQAAAKAANWQTRGWRSRNVARTGVVKGRGVACVNYEGGNGYAAVVADVSVDLDSGVVKPTRYCVAVDAGPISNPDGLKNQTEGGLLQGTSRALMEEVTWDSKRVTSTDWMTYHTLHLDWEVPEVETVLIEPKGVPAIGAGETSITLAPAVLGNAIFDATGVRLRDVPFTPARVKAAIAAARAA